MRKKFKIRKKFKRKKFLYYIFIFFIILFLNNLSNVIKNPLSNKLIINNILKNNNYSYIGQEKNLKDKIYNYIKENIFNEPINLLKNELKINNNKEIISFTYVESEKPRIYIYNSHQGEEYSKKYLEEYNIIPNVLTASLMLKDKLEEVNINAIVEENNILDYIKKNKIEHSKSYEVSRIYLTNILNTYPDMDLYIDLHRDSITHSNSTVTINDKLCAKILFVIGLENKNYKENLEVATKINNKILEKYPELTRGIIKKEGYGVNGVYNQDLNSNVILIEIGGYENNIEEINNTLDLMAIVIGEYLNEKK